MAALTAAPPGLIHTALGVLATSSTDSGSPIEDTWDRLLAHLIAAEAVALLVAIVRAATLLDADPVRARLATDLLVALDLYQAADALVDVAARGSEFALAAAALASHPGSDPALPTRLRRIFGGMDVPDIIREAFEIRLTGETSGDNSNARALLQDRWPGLNPSEGQLKRRTVLVHPSAGSAEERSLLIGQLHRLGVRIRLSPDEWKKPPGKGWVDAQALVVAGSGAALVELRERGLPVTPDHLIIARPPLAVSERSRVVELVAQRSGISARDRFSVPPLDEDVLAPGVFSSGAFDNHEMAYLGGVRHGVPPSVRRVLEPRKIASLNYWDFSQLVALRCWHYFKETSGKRRFPVDLVANLTSIARSQEETIVGVTSTGNVLYESGDAFVDARTGQVVPPQLVVRVDEVFRPIKMGAGHVPPLLAPSQFTRVHPETLAGTPTIAGRRIPVRAVALAALDDPRMAIRAYSELSEDEIADAVRVGRQLLAA